MDILLPKVEIDPSAGFCTGVRRAIRTSESHLAEADKIYCLGQMVHNEAELKRLADRGMQIISQEELEESIQGTVIIRTHGAPPETYESVQKHGHKLVDATCPVVLRLQQRVRVADAEMQQAGGQVVIFGKSGHPEVVGLLGQASGKVVVVTSPDDMAGIDFAAPIRLVAQTTANEQDFLLFSDKLKAKANAAINGTPDVQITNSICRQMSRRGPEIEKFARLHDVVIFVSGTESSNGKYLAGLSSLVNARTHMVSGTGQIERTWLTNAGSIGVTGATSTPEWLMQGVAAEIEEMIKYF